MRIDLTLRAPDRVCRECKDTGLMAMDNNVWQRCDCQPVPEVSDYDRAVAQRKDELAHMDAHPHVPLYLTSDEWRDSIKEHHNDEDD